MKKQSKTKTDIVRTLLTEGKLSPVQIAKKVGVTKTYVYNLRGKMNKRHEMSKKKETVDVAAAPVPVPATNGHGNGRISAMDFAMSNRLDACQHIAVENVASYRHGEGIDGLERAKAAIDTLIKYETRT